MTTKKLTRRQARWSLELSEYDFSLTHRPGKLNGRADSLSRREDYKSNTESSNFQRILDPQKIVDLQSLVADMDLHLLLHSQVLGKECQLDRSSSGIPCSFANSSCAPVALPFERWGIDFYGPMAETKSGNKYLDYLHRLCNSMGLGQAGQGHD
ncbi:hypothetical protein BASA81_008997 [Batrachochytrium salamandrivorans]|nr:hypothetical protein BASA81_008997 [Batrachochytrium salamandrivorans]